MELQGQDDEAITRQATEHLVERLPTGVDISEIETAVRDQVRELRSRAKVQNFVGIIAERNARRVLQRRGA
jgi:hypothetical protein